jgi:hypothetical protein
MISGRRYLVVDVSRKSFDKKKKTLPTTTRDANLLQHMHEALNIDKNKKLMA